MTVNQAEKRPQKSENRSGRGRALSEDLFSVPADLAALLAPTSITSPIASRTQRLAELPDASAFLRRDRFRVAVKCALQRIHGSGTPAAQLASRLGRSWKQVKRYMTADVEIPVAVLSEVAEAAELPLNWVLTGHVDSFRTSKGENAPDEVGNYDTNQVVIQVRNTSAADEPNFDLSTSKLEIAERIRHQVEQLGGIARAAELMGISYGRMQALAMDDADATPLELAVLSVVTGKSIDWIVLGLEPQKPPVLGEVMERVILVPRYDVAAAAGAGAFAEDGPPAELVPIHEIQLRGLRSAPRNLVMMQAAGDSMEPTLSDGEPILVDRSMRRVDEGIYVFRLDGQLSVKRLQLVGRSLSIISDNPAYPTREITGHDLEQLRVLGKVVWPRGK